MLRSRSLGGSGWGWHIRRPEGTNFTKGIMALHKKQKVKVVRHPQHFMPALIDGEPMPMSGVVEEVLDDGLYKVRVERVEPLLQFHEGQLQTPTVGEVFEMLAEYIDERGGGSIGFGVNEGEWTVSAIFGQEAEDSPMAGGAAHGIASTLAEAVEQAAGECGLLDD